VKKEIVTLPVGRGEARRGRRGVRTYREGRSENSEGGVGGARIPEERVQVGEPVARGGLGCRGWGGRSEGRK